MAKSKINEGSRICRENTRPNRNRITVCTTEFLPTFQNFLRILSNFSGKIMPIILENMILCICREFGGHGPPNLENLKNRTRKSNGNHQFFEKCP